MTTTPSAAQDWTAVATAWDAMISDIAPAQLAAVHETARQLVTDYASDGGLVLPGRALLVKGR